MINRQAENYSDFLKSQEENLPPAIDYILLFTDRIAQNTIKH